MDHFRGRFLLPITLYIATTILMIVEQSVQDEQCCESHQCETTSNTGSCYTEPTTIPIYLELNRTNALEYKCRNTSHCNVQKFMWYKVKRCGNCTRKDKFSDQNVFSFDSDVGPTDQGKYFCRTIDRAECQDSNPVVVVVTFQGVDTYLATFKLQCLSGVFFSGQRGKLCGQPYQTVMNDIEKCVNGTICPVFQAEKCSYFLRYLNMTRSYVEGYFYLEGSQSINKSESYKTVFENHRNMSFGCPLDMESVTLTSRTFQRVSFCESESINNQTLANLTFPKTKIGMNASSEEVCEDGEPRASMMCKGDFIRPSSWAFLDVKNCTDGNNSYSTMMTKNVTNNTTGTTNPDQDPTTVPTTNDPVGTRVTTVSISQTTTVINENTPVTKENVDEVSRILSEDTKNPMNIDAAYLTWISERLKNISEVGSSSETVTRNVMEIVDNLLNVREDVYEESISRKAPSSILRALEAQLTTLQKEENSITFVRSSVGAVARQFERPDLGKNITFGGLFPMEMKGITENMNESNVSVMTGNDTLFTKYRATITLPASLLDEISTGPNDRVPVTFIIHRTSFLFMSRSSHQRRHRESVESLVIAATVEGQNISNLSSPVISRFQLPRVEGTMTNNSRKCVFWDLTLGDGFGDWSSEGCELVIGSQSDTELMIECRCNHLTNFAVLLDVQGDIDHIVLDILSIIGCVVSIFALIVTLIVLLAVKKLREQVPQKIIINLCFALLGLYICFLVGIGQTSLGTGCIIFGALIHYFCLASVAWMCIVATNMYLLFVRVFNADVTGFMWKACLAAWGLPMVVVVVSVILKSQHYASSYCFPQAGSLIFYVGVVLLIALMLCYNLIIFIMVVRQVTCGRIGKPAGQDKRTEMFERAQSIIIISILVGLTWVFGFLSIGIARFFFNLLFLIFNSLQGFFVFVFFVLRPKNVRMILFRRCYRSQETNVGRYTVNKTKTDGTNEQKDTLDLDAIVVTSSQT